MTVKCVNLIGHSRTHTSHSDRALLKRRAAIHKVMGHKVMEWGGYLKKKTRYSIVFFWEWEPNFDRYFMYLYMYLRDPSLFLPR